MDTTDKLGNGIGGGEVLDYWDKAQYDKNSPLMNNPLISQFDLVSFIILLIAVLLIVLMIRVIMRMYHVKTLKKSKGMLNEIEYMERIKKHDASVIRSNKMILKLTNIVERTPFKFNHANKEYMEYNLERAGVKIPGKSRNIKAEEFNAIIVSVAALIVLLGVILGIFANLMLGIVIVVSTLILAGTLPMIYIRQTVQAKDMEIKENFSDFYLMLHYVLMEGAKTPLTGIMKSYAKTTDSKEMQHLVDVCTHYMDTYGEFEGTQYISKAYREVPSMCKLMRLIRQANEGGDIRSELEGFRAEILSEKKYTLEKRTDKLIRRAKASFNLLMPILLQAILSAMSIYLSDMNLIQTFVS